MRIAFYSNFLSSHQRPLCDALYAAVDGHFRFIAEKPLSETRKAMGWEEEQAPYIIPSYESDEAYQRAVQYIRDADVIIAAGVNINEFFTTAVKNKKAIVFRYSERLYGKGRWRALSPRGLWLRWQSYYKQPKKNLYMLCSSAYTAGDLALLGSYVGRCYKWAYFPDVPVLDIDAVLEQKDENTIFWAGRLLDWKHPESALAVAEYLRSRGIPFRMELAGDGPMRENLECGIKEKNLADCVRLVGSLSQEETHRRMEKAAVFLATSNYEEGWGAVVSESMSRGCAVVASEAMGATPFLIQNGQNGFSYAFGDEASLCYAVERLLTDRALRHSLGKNAYRTMHKLWNPTIAAQRLIALATALKSGEKKLFSDGPCSKARVFGKER